MELLYIWISEYKNLQNLEINFSNQYRFRYDKTTNKLSYSEYEYFIDNFYGQNISNVTALIGENGAGKTNVLRLIMDCIIDGENNLGDKIVLIYKINNILNIYYDKSINLIYDHNFLKKVNSYKNINEDLNLIYLSNHFDPLLELVNDKTKNQYSNLINLSTFYLLLNDYENVFKPLRSKEKTLSIQDHFYSHNIMEFNRQALLINNFYNKELIYGLPTYLVLSVNKDSEGYYLEKYKETFDVFYSYLKIPNLLNKDKFLINLFKSFFINFVSLYDYHPHFGGIITDWINKNKYDTNVYKSFYELLNFLDGYFLPVDDFVKDRIINFEDFFKKTNSLLITNKCVFDSKCENVYFSIPKTNISKFSELIELNNSLKLNENIVNFRFSHDKFLATPISSGESAILTIFSRLNSINKNILKKNIILMIDEAELALHPQWQKEIFNKLLNFVEKLFERHNLQIIITSHSPFLISDLTPNSIVFLKKINGKTEIAKDEITSKNTFGANIHELFTDTFFINNGLIGDFSKAKINLLIDKLKRKDNFDSEKEIMLLKKEINMIGEPFIKNKLFEMYFEKLPNEMAINEKIIQKEKELNDLKLKRNDKNIKR